MCLTWILELTKGTEEMCSEVVVMLVIAVGSGVILKD